MSSGCSTLLAEEVPAFVTPRVRSLTVEDRVDQRVVQQNSEIFTPPIPMQLRDLVDVFMHACNREPCDGIELDEKPL